jgi:hypothetical protein
MRAQRFPLHAPVRYRSNDSGWLNATTENISRTGLLLHVDTVLQPNTPIEMIVDLPPVQGDAGVKLVCHGEIVRTEPPPTGGERPLMAATIARYRFNRESTEAPDRLQSQSTE